MRSPYCGAAALCMALTGSRVPPCMAFSGIGELAEFFGSPGAPAVIVIVGHAPAEPDRSPDEPIPGGGGWDPDAEPDHADPRRELVPA